MSTDRQCDLRCDGCWFFEVERGPGGVPTTGGICRRYPAPALARVIVSANDWCGEWRKGVPAPEAQPEKESEADDV